jgi:hypothetical protein
VIRLARAAGAIVLGFAAATAVLIATGHSDDPNPPTVVGTPDFHQYCIATFGPLSSAVLVGHSAYGWRCTDRPNGIFTTVQVDFDGACRAIYGAGVRASTSNEDDVHAWECVIP